MVLEVLDETSAGCSRRLFSLCLAPCRRFWNLNKQPVSQKVSGAAMRLHQGKAWVVNEITTYQICTLLGVMPSVAARSILSCVLGNGVLAYTWLRISSCSGVALARRFFPPAVSPAPFPVPEPAPPGLNAFVGLTVRRPLTWE